ncbi:MAG: serine hydrolase, partial [Thermoleophilia bacterium]|nr:serine hydrolase [Thermoleophilia bacterium]
LVIVGGVARADVSPGDKINADNIDKVKGLISPGMEWCVQRGWPLTIGESKRIEWPQAYKEATEKYSAQVKLTPDGLDVENYVAGLPFPNIDPKDPQVAIKIMWNYSYNFLTTDAVDARNFDADTGSIADRGPLSVERHFLLDHFRRLFWTGRLCVEPKPEKPRARPATNAVTVSTAMAVKLKPSRPGRIMRRSRWTLRGGKRSTEGMKPFRKLLHTFPHHALLSAVVAIEFQARFTRMWFRFHLSSAMLLAIALGLSSPDGAHAFDLAIDDKLPPSQAVAVPAPPEQIDAAVNRLDELASAIMKKSGMPGLSVAVVRGGKTVYAKGFGVRKLGEDAKVDVDTVFQLASLSKPVGASVVAAQVGKGVVKWDDPIVKYLRWFALSDKAVSRMVTIG